MRDVKVVEKPFTCIIYRELYRVFQLIVLIFPASNFTVSVLAPTADSSFQQKNKTKKKPLTVHYLLSTKQQTDKSKQT